MTWTYTVTNVGDTNLIDVEVTDTWTTPSDATGHIIVTCPEDDTLAPGASLICTGSQLVGLDLFAHHVLPVQGSTP